MPIAFRQKSLLTGVALLFAQIGVACAQDLARAPDDETTSGAPYTTQYENGADAATLGQVAKVSISRGVSYDDLDLASTAGVDAFKSRVRVAAKDICKQIDTRFPAPMAENSSCVRAATNAALEKIKVVVASKGGNPRVAALP